MIADWPLSAQDGVIGGVEEISVEQALRKAVTVAGRAHLAAELPESLAPGGRDLRVDGTEKRPDRQQVLTRRALTARVLTTGSTRAAGGIVVRQRVQPSEQLTHHGELRGTVGEPGAFNEPRRQDRAAIEVRYRIAGRQALRSRNRRIAASPSTPARGRAGGNARATHGLPSLRSMRKHVGVMHTELRRRDRVYAVAIPEMSE